MIEYFIVALAALISGVIQGSCGFGAGIILMIALPFYYPLSQAAGVSCIMNIALIAAMLLSSVSGTVIPIFFKKIGIDPAVASGPLITTVNDLVAVVSYYGLTWLLLIEWLHLA